eukprot:350561-Chlamydomonas_euryale.AAC.7
MKENKVAAVTYHGPALCQLVCRRAVLKRTRACAQARAAESLPMRARPRASPYVQKGGVACFRGRTAGEWGCARRFALIRPGVHRPLPGSGSGSGSAQGSGWGLSQHNA